MSKIEILMMYPFVFTALFLLMLFIQASTKKDINKCSKLNEKIAFIGFGIYISLFFVL